MAYPSAERGGWVREVRSDRWCKEYGGLNGGQLRRLKDLEKERRRHAVSDLDLDKQILSGEAGPWPQAA